MQPLELTSPAEVLRWVAEIRTQADDLRVACDNAAFMALGEEPEEPAPSRTIRPR